MKGWFVFHINKERVPVLHPLYNPSWHLTVTRRASTFQMTRALSLRQHSLSVVVACTQNTPAANPDDAGSHLEISIAISSLNDFALQMRKDYRLLFGPVAGIILAFGIAGLALMIPGYSHVHQTVSEIGEIDSPARVPFAVMLCCVAACILVFAAAVRGRSLPAGHSPSAAYLIGFMALSAAGVGLFAYPSPLHNVFGISELVGYQAPLCLALTWRRDPRARP